MYFLVVIICVGAMLTTGSVSVEGAEHLLCYSCENIHTSEDCMNVTMCTSGEDCYGRADGMPSGEVRYTVGCTRDTTAVMSVHTFCTDECHENRCNINKCHMPISPKGNPDRPPRCLSCDLISSPSQCTNMVQCLDNQICYAREITVYGNQRYRMGCIDKQHCSDTPTTQAPSSPQLVGKRSLNESCSLCCGSDHCNALVCDSQHHHSLGDSFELKLLGSNSTCEDSNPMACASFGALSTDACGIVPNVDKMCPKTCGVCGHFGWSSWNDWSSCSTTCNDGTSQRSRTCLHQIGVSHPHNCPGNDTESTVCNLGYCLVKGNWSDWESWGECSRTCSNGTNVRVRQCQSPSLQQGGLYCDGERLEESECQGQPCLDETPCPDQWIGYHNSCYFFGLDGTTFDNGQAFCQHREATLVHIESSEENQFLVSHLLTFKDPGDGWWIGMKHSNQYYSTEWHWYPENTRVTYTNWYPGHDNGRYYPCAVLYPRYNFSMSAVTCSTNGHALCEKHD